MFYCEHITSRSYMIECNKPSSVLFSKHTWLLQRNITEHEVFETISILPFWTEILEQIQNPRWNQIKEHHRLDVNREFCDAFEFEMEWEILLNKPLVREIQKWRSTFSVSPSSISLLSTIVIVCSSTFQHCSSCSCSLTLQLSTGLSVHYKNKHNKYIYFQCRQTLQSFTYVYFWFHRLIWVPVLHIT